MDVLELVAVIMSYVFVTVAFLLCVAVPLWAIVHLATGGTITL